MNPKRRRLSSDASKDEILELAENRPLVCATIFAKDKEEFQKNAIKSAKLGCDLVELRIDHLRLKEPGSIEEIIRNSPLPLIVTNRSDRDGGLFPSSKEKIRRSIIQSSIESKPTFVDIEYNISAIQRSNLIQKAWKNGVGVICSHHDFKSTPPLPDILNLFRGISQTGADITKLAFMPKNRTEASRILEATEDSSLHKKKFTIFGMGRFGESTRLSTLLLGSCMVYCSVSGTANRLRQTSVQTARRFVDQMPARI